MNGTDNTSGKALAELRTTLNAPCGNDLITAKAEHPADGSDRWIVAGPDGAVVYDVLGNHLAILFADGEIDSMCKRYADEARSVSEYFDDNTVFALLADHYRVVLAGGAR